MASDLIIKRKEEEVALIAKKMQDSASVIVVDYKGLRVSDMTNLRKALVNEGIEFKVLKNNLVRRAAKNLGYDELVPYLEGPSAFAFSDKIVEPAKILDGYAKEFDTFSIKAGIVEHNYADASSIKELASIPSMEGLLTMLAGSMLSPLKDIAVGLNMLVEGEGNFEFK